MEFEPNYGSSEYSTKAEELFAGFLLDAEEGAERDFEDFCSEHDTYSDELYGLHADWDNVRGLLAQLKGRRTASAPAPAPAPAPEPQPDALELARREAAIEPFSAKDVPDPEDEYAGRPQKAWKVVAGVGALLAAVSCVWAAQLSRNTQVLAHEKQTLVESRDNTRVELESALTEGRALAQREAKLSTELATTLKAKGVVEVDRDTLSEDLEQERTRQRELATEHAQLGQQLELERSRHATAAREASAAKVQVAALALRVRGDELIAREASLWPSSPERMTSVATWLTDAKRFAGRWQELQQATSEPLAGAEQIAPLVANGGLIEQTQRRQIEMQTWQAEAAAPAGGSWDKALQILRDPAQTPLYQGLELTPQFGLLPLGPDAESGLWRFADRQTGTLEGPETSALVFVLIPGIELEGQRVDAFFVSEGEWSVEQRQFLRADRATLLQANTLQGRIEYELDLLRMGYESLSSLQAGLARQHGLDVASWRAFPVRALVR